jgi:hypothetical protein
MGLDQNTVTGLADMVNAQPGERVQSAEPVTTLLHELLHAQGTVADAPASAQAYVRPGGGKAVEEGFTELGSRLDAAEFARRIGVGDKPTALLARDPRTGGVVDNPAYGRARAELTARLESLRKALTADRRTVADGSAHSEAIVAVTQAAEDVQDDDPAGVEAALQTARHTWSADPVVKAAIDSAASAADRLAHQASAQHQTVSQALEAAADPRLLRAGRGVAYPQWVRQAQAWSEAIAAREAKIGLIERRDAAARAAELAREVAYAGGQGKAAVLARQLLRAEGLTDSGKMMENGETLTAFTERNILQEWDSAGTQVAAQVGTEVEQLRRWLDAGK